MYLNCLDSFNPFNNFTCVISIFEVGKFDVGHPNIFLIMAQKIRVLEVAIRYVHCLYPAFGPKHFIHHFFFNAFTPKLYHNTLFIYLQNTKCIIILCIYRYQGVDLVLARLTNTPVPSICYLSP